MFSGNTFQARYTPTFHIGVSMCIISMCLLLGLGSTLLGSEGSPKEQVEHWSCSIW